MPAQLPAGGPGAEAPREQPASPTTDDAPPPVKQEYTGAQGAEIAGSADSASAGPGASDSLAAQQSTMAATASTRATTVDHPGQHHMELRSQVSIGGGEYAHSCFIDNETNIWTCGGYVGAQNGQN